VTPPARPRLRFLTSSRANLFMPELDPLGAGGARAAGLDVEIVRDRWPAIERDVICVAIPHETFPFLPRSPEHLAHTVALCTEQPGTIFFARAAAWADACGAAVDISPVGTLALREAGVPARHLQLGWTPSLPLAPLDGPRPVDVLYLGSAAARREVLLSGYADALWPLESRLLIPPHWAKLRERADFVVGARKRALLSRAKVLLSVRRQPAPYFEWARALDALAAGTVLVAEHAAGLEPLEAGQHLVLGAAESLGLLAAELVERPDELARMREAAREALLALPMGIGVLEEVAATLVRAPRAPAADDLLPAAGPVPPPGPEAPPRPPDDEPGARAARERIAARRAAERAAAADPDGLEVLHDTTAPGGPPPRAAVLIPAYRATQTLPEALASVAAQTIAADLEVLVHDDHCPDGSGAVAAAFLRERPWLRAKVVRRAANAGLPAGRNTLAGLARAPYLLMLDADNALLPPCAERLAAALDADPEAAFAYPTLAAHSGGEPAGLLSSLAWDPELLPVLNPIDALALVRAGWLERVGGYVDDLGLYGWEDWDLWCAVAEAGGHGVHVPQMLARYRRAPGSMLATTDLDQEAKRARLAARHPRLFAARAATRGISSPA
jgi:hypothetical protein